jgi:DNA (cytosine-5)-methyltransferase 1
MSEDCGRATPQPTAVDLFCGAGGASCGIDAAGFDIRAAVDVNEQALQTHHENLSGEPIVHDLTEIDTSVLPEDARDPTYVHGSTVCKGFSTAGDQDPDDPRNALVFRFVDWLDALQPAVATMENVPAMQTITTGFMGRLEDAFDDAGYQISWRVLNAADYGVPQTRRRLFTVAVRDDLETPKTWFPAPTHAETRTTTLDGNELQSWVPVQEVIGDLVGDVLAHKNGGAGSPAAGRGADAPSHTVTGANNHLLQADGGLRLTDQINEAHQREGRRPLQRGDNPANTIRAGTPPYVFNHVEQDHDESTRKAFAAVEPGTTTEGMSKRRLAADAPSFTITADEGAAVPPIHYSGPVLNHEPTEPEDHDTHEDWDGARRLTVRECARLQSFPDWFVFTGTKTEQYAQVGNAVPPLLQYQLADHVRTEVLA